MFKRPPPRLMDLACLLALVCAPGAAADDTEVYTKVNPSAAPLNNLLLMIESADPMEIESAEGLINFYSEQDIQIRIGLMRYEGDPNGMLAPIERLDEGHKMALTDALMNGTHGELSSITDALEEIEEYFNDEETDKTDHEECRKNHVLVFTDGMNVGCDDSGPACLDKITKGLLEEHNIQTHFVRFSDDENKSQPGTEKLTTAAAKGDGELIEAASDPFPANDSQTGFAKRLAAPAIIPARAQVSGMFRPRTVRSDGRIEFDDHIYISMFQPDARARWRGNVKKYGLKTDRDGRITEIIDADGKTAVDENGEILAGTTSDWRLPGQGADGASVTDGGAAERLYPFEDGQHVADKRQVYTWNPATDSPTDLTEIRSANRLPDIPGLPTSCFTGELLEETTDKTLIQWISGLDVCDEDEDEQTDDGRPTIGAVLHSRPQLVPFGGMTGDVLLFAGNDGYLHMLRIDETDKTAGLELAAIFPGSLLADDAGGGGYGYRRTHALFNNRPGEPIHRLDGDISVHTEDANNDGDLLDAQDKAIAYFGQRRGGRSVFAIDLGKPTDPEWDNPFGDHPPRLLWHFQGGPDPHFPQYRYLGETWSTPLPATIQDKHGNPKQVVLFGGGYHPAAFAKPGKPVLDCRAFDPDDNRDCKDHAHPTLDEHGQVGSAIYMVDAETGASLWWAGDGSAAMNYAFTATLRLVDTDRDGSMDMFLAVDMGGQVWRFDIAPPVTSADSSDNLLSHRITGGIIADLHGGADSETHHRRFFNRPDAAISTRADGRLELRIAIGSGYRAHPLDTGTQDRMYVLTEPLNRPATYTKRTIGDLADITDYDPAEDLKPANLNNGWYLDLNQAAGEKVLADARTLFGITYFTTYTPPADPPAPCEAPKLGTTRLYAVGFRDGRAILNLDGSPDGSLERSVEVEFDGIPPSPELLFDADGAQVILGSNIIANSRAKFNRSGREILYWTSDDPGHLH